MYKKIIISNQDIEELKQRDEKMALLISEVGDVNREYIEDPFIALVNSIVYQQIAIKAANAIWNRFAEYVKEITPRTILDTDDEELRACGLSKTKVQYIKNIAIAVEANELEIDRLEQMSNDEIIQQLVEIKGIGTWTAEMFLIFSLNRKDVMSYKDLAIIKGIKWLYNLKKDPTLKQFNQFKTKFSPYNTLASFYLWEITMQNLFKFPNIESVTLKHQVAYVDSPIGLVELQAKDGEIIRLEFVKDRRYKENLDETLILAKRQIQEYFRGERTIFTLPYRLEGTDFQSSVWNELINVSFGDTKSYKEIAVAIGNEHASRAIGNANNKNKIAIIIPCHRVVGANGKLVGYEGGLWRKEWLLKHEASNKASLLS